MAAEFFLPFALTVTYALIASLLVSLTVVPVFVTWLLTKGRVGHRESDKATLLQRAYLPVLRLALSHKLITVILAIAIFGRSTLAIPFLKTNLIDDPQSTSISITQTFLPGTDIAATSQSASSVKEVLAAIPDIENDQVTVGSTGDVFTDGGRTHLRGYEILESSGASRPRRSGVEG